MISQQHHAFCTPQVAGSAFSKDRIQPHQLQNTFPAVSKPSITTTIYPTIANIVSSSSPLSLSTAGSPQPSALPSPSSEYESGHEPFWSHSPEPESDALSGETRPWRHDPLSYPNKHDTIGAVRHSGNMHQRYNRPPSYPAAVTNGSNSNNSHNKETTSTIGEGAYRIEKLNDVDDVAPAGLGHRERAWAYSYPPPSARRSQSPSPPNSFDSHVRLPPIAPRGSGGSLAPSSLPSTSTLYSPLMDLPPSLQYRRSSASSTTTTTSSCSSTSSFVGPVKSYLRASQARRRKVVLPPHFDRVSDAQKRLYECHPPSPIHSDDDDDDDDLRSSLSSDEEEEGSCSSTPSSAPESPALQRRYSGFPSSFSSEQDRELEQEHKNHRYGSDAPPPPPPPHYLSVAPRAPTLIASPYKDDMYFHRQEHHHHQTGSRAAGQGFLRRSSWNDSSYSSSGSTPSPAAGRSPSTKYCPSPSMSAMNPHLLSHPAPFPLPIKPRRRVRASPPGGFMSTISSPETLFHGGGPGTVTTPDGTKVIKGKDGSIMVYNPQTDSVTFRCELCPGETFGRIHDLKRHQTSKHQEMTWPCDFCHRPFVRRDALLRHYTVKAARDDGLHPATHEVEKLMAARARAKMLC